MKLLAISLYRPPQLTPQAIQIGRLLHHTEAQITLVCGRDEKLKDDFRQYPDFAQRLHRVIDVSTPAPLLQGRLFNLARRVWPLYGEAPDVFTRWQRTVFKTCLQVLASECEQPDVVVSFGQPMSSHLAGLKLKQAVGLPWLAHFSDPWADNPYMSEHPLVRSVNRRLEASVIEHADRLLFTSSATLRQVMNRYPATWQSKASVLPHSFDFSGVGETCLPNSEPLVLRHLGALYSHRSPAPLFKALRQLVPSCPDLVRSIRVELIGPASPAFQQLDDFKALPEGLVRFLPSVGYEESLRLMKSAYFLLAIDAPATESVFLPSKLVDYLGASRPILAITPPGTSRELVQQVGGLTADPTDVAGIAALLEQAVADPQTLVARRAAEPVQRYIERYTTRSVGREFLHQCAQATSTRLDAPVATVTAG